MARIELSEADSGTTVEAHAGDEIVLDLDETATSGHRWVVVESAGPLEGPILDEFRPGSDGIGAAGRRVLVFRASEPGTGRVTLVRRQEWEPDQPSGSFTAEIRISRVVARGFEPRVHQGVEDEVGERERRGSSRVYAGCAGQRRRVGEVGVQLGEQGAWLGEDVPAVPAFHAAEEDAGADQQEHTEDARPADRGPEAVSHDRVHEVQGDEAEQHARPCGRPELDSVEPSGGMRAADKWTKSVTR